MEYQSVNRWNADLAWKSTVNDLGYGFRAGYSRFAFGDDIRYPYRQDQLPAEARTISVSEPD